jgi:mono/diheme cytochrome c family protein
MRSFRLVRLAGLFVAGALLAGPALAQTPTVKKAVAPKTSPGSGQEMFTAYCAACHGPAGKGDGPAAPALKTKPADLSGLSARNGGVFPVNKVEGVLRFGIATQAHGSSDMPTWGPTFQAMGDEMTVKLRISNIVRYLQGLQGK